MTKNLGRFASREKVWKRTKTKLPEEFQEDDFKIAYSCHGSWNHGVFYYELIDKTHKAVDQQWFDDFMKRMNQTLPRHMIVQLDNASVHGNVQIPWSGSYIH